MAFVEASIVARGRRARTGSGWWPGRRPPTSTRTATEAAAGGRCLRTTGLTETRIGRLMAPSVGQRQSRAAQRGRRRLPAHGRLPQAGDGRTAAGTGPLPLHGDRRLVLPGLRPPADPARGAAPAADRDGHGPDGRLVVGALRRGGGPRHRRDRRGRLAHHGRARDRPKLPEVIARREARETRRYRRERADGRHDDEGRQQRAPHHAGRPAGRLRAGDGRGRGHGARRRAAGLAVAGAVGILLIDAGLPGRPSARPRQVGRRRDPAALRWTCSCGASCAPGCAGAWRATGTGSCWPAPPSSCAGS